MTQPSPSIKRKYSPSSQPQPQPQTSLKERRRPHLKPLRIAPTTTTTTTSPPSITPISPSSRLPPPPPLVPTTSYPTPTTSSSSSSASSSSATSATSSASATPTFDQNDTFEDQLPQKQKRRRRSPEEFAELLSVFEKTPKPCRQLREHLSRRLNMSIREVQIWFQNQRAKVSRQARLTPSTTSISNTMPIPSPTRRSTYPMADDGYPRIPMTPIGLVHGHPYSASPYRQSPYPLFLDRNPNSCNHPEDQGNSKPMLYPASPVSINDHQRSLSTYYGEGATLPASNGSSHQRSQSQPHLFSYTNYNMDDAYRHQPHLSSYPDAHAQRFGLAKGDYTSSVPVTPTSSSPCSILSSEERRQVTDEEVQTFADAMALLAKVAAQDQQDPSKVEEDSCKDDCEEIMVVEPSRSSLTPEKTTSCENDLKESHEPSQEIVEMLSEVKDQTEETDTEGKEPSALITPIVEEGDVNPQEPASVTNQEDE